MRVTIPVQQWGVHREERTSVFFLRENEKALQLSPAFKGRTQICWVERIERASQPQGMADAKAQRGTVQAVGA